jgi:uncharacterized membrane protein
MAFCPNCGAETPGRFCPNCGTDIAAAGSAPPRSPSSAGLNENVIAALCYVGWLITGIIFLFVVPYNTNRTIRFHAWQSIFMSIAVIVILKVLNILLFSIFGFGLLGIELLHVADLAAAMLWVYMIYAAYTGKKVKLPLIGDLAVKQS